MVEIVLDVSNKTASLTRKPLIKKGYYPAKLVEVKPRQKKDGTIIEGQWGKQLVCMFGIYDQNKKPVTITEKKEGEASVTKELKLPLVLNSEYKQEGGGYRTAVTPNSRITKVFKALGWIFDDTKPLKPGEYVGNWVEANVDDYEAEIEVDGKIEKYDASSIKDVSVLKEGEAAAEPKQTVHEELKETVVEVGKAEPTETTKKADSFADQVKQLTELNAKKMLSDDGLKMALEQLEKQNK